MRPAKSMLLDVRSTIWKRKGLSILMILVVDPISGTTEIAATKKRWMIIFSFKQIFHESAFIVIM